MKSQTQDDFSGGILADEMGLGKTLTALATISASKKSAAAFAKAEQNHTAPVTRATLVIVPSERASPLAPQASMPCC